MTLVNSVTAKFAVAIVAVAMALAAYAPANAQDVSDMSLEELIALVTQLQSQLGQSGSTTTGGGSAASCYTFTRDLTIGATGADVMELQKFLMAAGQSIPAGPSDYFGSQTQAALAAWQAANGVSPAAGYFGPITRAAVAAACVPADDADDDDATEDEDEDEDDEDMTLSGEASLDIYELEDGESTLEEGDEDAVIGELTVEFTDGDAEISRLDFSIAGGSAEPWEAFETFSLWVDGDMVAEFDASDENEYLNEDEGEFRFTGLDIVAQEDEELEIMVAATVQNNLDAAELTDWTLTGETIRFFDADGVATTENNIDGLGVDTAEFEVQEAGTDEELDISLAPSNPDSTDLIVDTDTDTNDVTIMVAEVEAEDNDIELNKIVVLVETGSASTTAVVDEARIVIDGEEFNAEAISGTGTTSAMATSRFVDAAGTAVWYVFDVDGDIVIDADDSVEMEVVVDLNDTDDGLRYPNGTQIEASVGSDELDLWEAEGADDLDNDQFSGSASGDQHTLVAEGIAVPADGFQTESVTTTGQNDTTGIIEVTFEVTAVEGDFYINDRAGVDTGIDATLGGVGFSVDGATTSFASLSATLTSEDAEDDTGAFIVEEGTTETFVLRVTLDPNASGDFRVILTEVWYSEDDDGENASPYLPAPASSFRSSFVNINQI
jgi:hypothetical protein